MPTVLELNTISAPTSPRLKPVDDFSCRIFTERWDDGSSYINLKFHHDSENGHAAPSAMIEPESFEQLAQIMIETDSAAAIRAFGAALKNYRIGQPSIEAEG